VEPASVRQLPSIGSAWAVPIVIVIINMAPGRTPFLAKIISGLLRRRQPRPLPGRRHGASDESYFNGRQAEAASRRMPAPPDPASGTHLVVSKELPRSECTFISLSEIPRGSGVSILKNSLVYLLFELSFPQIKQAT
jgi:hypothetical protein